jgi:tetratricopeptide (TPR) repeat protein
VKWWQKCLELEPRRADVYSGLATVAYMKGEYDKALELSRKAQEISPNMPGIYSPAAKILLETSRPQEAVAALEKEIRLSPGDFDSYLLLGQAYAEQREYAKAAENYQKALELAPGDSRPYYGLGSVYARQGQADKSREYMEKFGALRAREEHDGMSRRRASDDRLWTSEQVAHIYTDAGVVYAAYHRPKDAEQHWLRAAALHRKQRKCREALVDLYRRSGRLPEALAVGEQLRQIVPTNAHYQLNAGALLMQLRRFDEAETALRKAVELAPDRPPGYRALAQLLLNRNQKLPEAQALARKLVALEPTAANWSVLAEACRRNGDLPGARAALERALELEPGNERLKAGYKALQEGK